MGSTESQTENLIKYYVSEVPNLPKNVKSGKDVNEYYENKHKFVGASLFMNPKFESKINEVAKSQEEADYLWFLANGVNQQAQKMFEFQS